MEQFKFIDHIQNEMVVQSVIKHRKIHLNDEVDRDSMFKVMYYMDRIKYLDDKENIPMEKRRPIEIVINSYGGYCYHGLALISKMLHFRELGYEIISTVESVAMSMGFMIAIVSTKRKAYRYATLMCHQILSGSYGKYQDMKEDMVETERLWKVLKDIIMEHTCITESDLEDITKRKFDWYMDSQTALDFGCIDEII